MLFFYRHFIPNGIIELHFNDAFIIFFHSHLHCQNSPRHSLANIQDGGKTAAYIVSIITSSEQRLKVFLVIIRKSQWKFILGIARIITQ